MTGKALWTTLWITLFQLRQENFYCFFTLNTARYLTKNIIRVYLKQMDTIFMIFEIEITLKK